MANHGERKEQPGVRAGACAVPREYERTRRKLSRVARDWFGRAARAT